MKKFRRVREGKGCSERAALAGAGCEMPPDPPARIEREVYNLYTACTLPFEKLILTFPAAQNPKDDGRAEIIDKLSCMFGFPVSPVPPPSVPHRELPVSRDPLSPESALALYGQTLSLSASRVETFSLCPFSYFCKYGLKAERRPEAGFSPLDVGRELHIILERCVKYAMERGGFTAIPRDEFVYYAGTESRARLDTLIRRGNTETARLLAQGTRIVRTAQALAGRLWDEFIHSRFTPLGFELPVETPMTPLSGLPGGAPSGYKLRGSADRVDGFSKDGILYLRVIDYKTGGKAFSLPDVYNGLSAQMPLYLFLLRLDAPDLFGAERAEAAGVLYVQTRDLVASPDAKHNGLLLNDPEILEAMDDRVRGEGSALPVSFNKDGSFAKRSSVISPEEMNSLQTHIGRLVRGTARSVACGRLEAAPLALRESPCERCCYRAACLFDGETDKARLYEVIK
jgi:ATP-dependent helicase/nuclease subunit B